MSSVFALFTVTALTLFALTLTGCASSPTPTVLPPVRPPTTGLLRCEKPPLPEQLRASEVLAALIRHRTAIDLCEQRRQALVTAWPR